MASLSLSSASAQTFSLYCSSSSRCKFASVSQPRLVQAKKLSGLSSLRYNPLRVSISGNGEFTAMMTKKKKKTIRRGMSTVCYAAPLSVNTIQWIATVSSAVLLFTKGTAVQKSFLVPLFALQAPGTFISWIKGEYGMWTAFLALLTRLFFFVPGRSSLDSLVSKLGFIQLYTGELELPLVALLLVIVAPYQVMGLRGKQEGAIVSLVIAGYLAFQHFSRIGSLNQSFDRGSIVATLAIICITVLSCLLLF